MYSGVISLLDSIATLTTAWNVCRDAPSWTHMEEWTPFCPDAAFTDLMRQGLEVLADSLLEKVMLSFA